MRDKLIAEIQNSDIRFELEYFRVSQHSEVNYHRETGTFIKDPVKFLVGSFTSKDLRVSLPNDKFDLLITGLAKETGAPIYHLLNNVTVEHIETDVEGFSASFNAESSTGWKLIEGEWKERDELKDDILEEIKEERYNQDMKWGDEFDKKNTPNDWLAYITGYTGKALTLPWDKDQFRSSLIKVAALCMAAIENVDRGTYGKRHYDE